MEDNIIECGDKLPGLIGACFLNPTQDNISVQQWRNPLIK